MLQNLYVSVSHSLPRIFVEIQVRTIGFREYVLIDKVNRVNEEVIIRLKWGQTEYKGRLVSIDSYMNIQLAGAEEWIDQQMTSVLGQVLIRCVVYLFADLGVCWGSQHKKTGIVWGLDSGRVERARLILNYRCNNVLWIQGANQNNGNVDTKMEG